jgi:hypothetical protein
VGEGRGDWDPDHKDPVPTYDNVGGPPKYVEMEMEMEMDSAQTRLHLDLAGAHYEAQGRSLEGGESPLSMHSSHETMREPHLPEDVPEERDPTPDCRLPCLIRISHWMRFRYICL